MKTVGTNPKKSEERMESAGVALFGSRPRDPIFEFTEEGSTGKENERISKDVQKFALDTKTEIASKEASYDNNDDEEKADKTKYKEKPDKTKRYKTRKEPQIGGPVESENLINIANGTEIIDFTKKWEGVSSGGKNEEKEDGGLITTWKEIRTAAGALPQKIRTIIVPLHKVF